MYREATPSESIGQRRGLFHGLTSAEPTIKPTTEPAADARPWNWLDHANLWIWCLLGVGVAIRVGRYLLQMPLWGDEAFVAANFLEGGFLELLDPLQYHQVCPPLYLWIQMGMVKLMGFSLFSLRLVAVVAGVASLFLFRRLVLRVLDGWASVLAFGILAASYYPFRHAVEVKPYSTDLLASLALLLPAMAWLDDRRNRWLWTLAVVAPIAIGLSHPAVFVAGGVSLALLMPVLRQRPVQSPWAYGVFNACVLVAFGIVYALVTGDQYQEESKELFDYWALGFPPASYNPLVFLQWLWRAHASFVCAYPVGGKNGASVGTLLCVIAGAVVLWRRGQRDKLALLLGPVGLAIVAAVLHRYPYGGSTRVVLYLAPVFCLLAGAGLEFFLQVLARGIELVRNRVSLPAIEYPLINRRVHLVTVSVLVALAIGYLVTDMVRPYKRKYDLNEQSFARWFWTEQAHDAELVCVKTDLGRDFFPLNFEWGQSAIYWCNQRLYSPAHRKGSHQPDWSAITASHPLRCVVFNVPNYPCDQPAMDQWLAEMQAKYDLNDQERFTVNSQYPQCLAYYDVYEFVPKR